MCKQASMILVFDRQTESISAHFHPMKDSHTEILKLIGIKEDRTEPEKCNFVRVEIVPPNGDILQPVDTWEYTVDEPDLNRLPEWYKQAEQHCEYVVREALPEYLKTRITVGDAIGANRAIMAGGDGATLTGGDGAKLTGGYGSTLTGGVGSTLIGGYGSTLTGGNRAKLTGGDWATLIGGDGATLTGGDRSTLTGGVGSTLTGGDGAKLTGGDRSTLISKWYDCKTDKTRVAVAYVGENGIKPGVKYHVVNGVFEEVAE
jgi:hypothetical protein